MKTTVSFGRIAAMAVLMATIGSCSGLTMKGYQGAHLSATAMAVISSGAYTHLESYDGFRIPSLYLNVSVSPGTHTVEVAFVRRIIGNKLLYPTGTGFVSFFAEPGHRYAVYAEAVPESKWMGVVVSGFNWVGYVTDEETGKQIARTEPLPLKAEHVFLPFYQLDTY